MKRLWLMYICFKCSNYFLLIPVIILIIISDLTCLVMESISLTYRSCSVRTPAHTEHINNYSWRPEGCTVSWYERPHRYCRAAAVCSESRCWFSPPSAPETQREELPVWIGQLVLIHLWPLGMLGLCLIPFHPVHFSPSLSPRSRRRRCVRSPLADPGGRTTPRRSGKSWTSSDSTGAASRSELGLTPPRWDTHTGWIIQTDLWPFGEVLKI